MWSLTSSRWLEAKVADLTQALGDVARRTWRSIGPRAGRSARGLLPETTHQIGTSRVLAADSIPVCGDLRSAVSQLMLAGGLPANLRHSAAFRVPEI